jgi:ketopantoate reductase
VENGSASRRLELDYLIGEVLGVARDAGIAVAYAPIMHPKFAAKSPIISTHRFSCGYLE